MWTQERKKEKVNVLMATFFGLGCWNSARGTLSPLSRECRLKIFENLSFDLLIPSFCWSFFCKKKFPWIVTLIEPGHNSIKDSWFNTPRCFSFSYKFLIPTLFCKIFDFLLFIFVHGLQTAFWPRTLNFEMKVSLADHPDNSF